MLLAATALLSCRRVCLGIKQQGTGNVLSLPCCMNSNFVTSTQLLGTSQLGSVVSIDMGAGDILHASRPLRPVPLRPMPGFVWPGRCLHKESEGSHSPDCWNHSTLCEGIPSQQFNAQVNSSAPIVYFKPEDENNGRPVAVGSLPNP